MINDSPYQMKRDMDLVRLLLLRLAGEDVNEDIAKYGERQVNYHELLLLEAELVQGVKVDRADGWSRPYLNCLSWKGQEFLDSIRSPSIWSEVKSRASKIGAFTIPIIQTLAAEAIKAKVMGP